MNENITELWRIVESLQLELTSLRNNVTSSGIDASVAASQVDSMATDMDSFWLMLGSILIVCECWVAAMVNSCTRTANQHSRLYLCSQTVLCALGSL